MIYIKQTSELFWYLFEVLIDAHLLLCAVLSDHFSEGEDWPMLRLKV